MLARFSSRELTVVGFSNIARLCNLGLVVVANSISLLDEERIKNC